MAQVTRCASTAETEEPAAVAQLEAVDALDRDYLRAAHVPGLPAGDDALEIVDLFAGCGGMTFGAIEGARRSGRAARLGLAVDSDPDSLGVLAGTLGAPDMCVVADIGKVFHPVAEAIRSAERHLLDPVSGGGVLLAGPPCQGHSSLNNHTRHDDPRNDLYLAVARVARITMPRAVIIENVKSIASDRRDSVGKCAAALEELGYEVNTEDLNLHEIGVPQLRQRHVLVATLGAVFDWDLAQVPGRTVRWAIEDLLSLDDPTDLDAAAGISADNQRRIAWLFDNDEFDLSNRRRPKCHRSDHTYRSMYGRLHWDKPAQTITTGFGSMGQGRYVHPAARRVLTHHEAARLQFLPDFIRFRALRRRRGAVATMIGNAAPPKLTMAIVEALLSQGLL